MTIQSDEHITSPITPKDLSKRDGVIICLRIIKLHVISYNYPSYTLVFN